LHLEDSKDFNEIILEYGVPDTVIESFKWDGNLTPLIANLGSSPNYHLELLDKQKWLLNRQPLQYLPELLFEEEEFSHADPDPATHFAERPPTLDLPLSGINAALRQFQYNNPKYYKALSNKAKKKIEIKYEDFQSLEGFVRRITKDEKTFETEMLRMSKKHSTEKLEAIYALLDSFKNEDSIKRTFRLTNRETFIATAQRGATTTTSRINTDYVPIKKILGHYIANRFSWSTLPFVVEVTTLGIPELDNILDLASMNGRVVKLKLHDISREKRAEFRGEPVYHFLTGTYYIIEIAHKMTTAGYRTQLKLQRTAFSLDSSTSLTPEIH
jgi:hypothetical protein